MHSLIKIGNCVLTLEQELETSQLSGGLQAPDDGWEVLQLGAGEKQGGDILVHVARGFGEVEVGYHA